MSLPPQRPLDERWTPDLHAFRLLFPDLDVDASLRRFRLFYSEGQTARNWDGKFELWLLNDRQRFATKQEDDVLGRRIKTAPSRVSDPDPDEVEALIQAGIEAAKAATTRESE